MVSVPIAMGWRYKRVSRWKNGYSQALSQTTSTRPSPKTSRPSNASPSPSQALLVVHLYPLTTHTIMTLSRATRAIVSPSLKHAFAQARTYPFPITAGQGGTRQAMSPGGGVAANVIKNNGGMPSPSFSSVMASMANMRVATPMPISATDTNPSNLGGGGYFQMGASEVVKGGRMPGVSFKVGEQTQNKIASILVNTAQVCDPTSKSFTERRRTTLKIELPSREVGFDGRKLGKIAEGVRFRVRTPYPSKMKSYMGVRERVPTPYIVRESWLD
ncbi:hypothetical protein BD410DRAFT_838725 [Rickenella mellea]|uniref:Uncharacterized protein n=1 Tax=Rickenella mellea TaxID=50990 RepID=A0A4Y7QA68_9AGAM|nr:hypothetical protein BD410DRAFT_838725 [Rickenella mellea]